MVDVISIVRDNWTLLLIGLHEPLMLATSLAPDGYLDFPRAQVAPVRSAVRSRR